jgi:hypothetical protein
MQELKFMLGRFKLRPALAWWLRHYATNRQVAGSIPDGFNGIFKLHNPSGRTMALGSTQFQKWVWGVFPGGKGGRCVRLTILPPSCAVVMNSGNLNFLDPSGPLQACNGTALLLPYRFKLCNMLIILLAYSYVYITVVNFFLDSRIMTLLHVESCSWPFEWSMVECRRKCMTDTRVPVNSVQCSTRWHNIFIVSREVKLQF